MNYIKLFVVSLLFGIALSGSAAVTETKEVKLVALTDGFIESIKATTPWQPCGSFFAAADSLRGRVVRLSYVEAIGDLERSAFTTAVVATISVATDVDLLYPIATFSGPERSLALTMNVVDRVIAEPCLDKMVDQHDMKGGGE